MNKRIYTKELTKLRHKQQTCKVFEVKVDKSKLSSTTLKQLYSLFKEAKQFYNYCLSQKNLNNADTKIKIVPVKVKDVFEDRKLTTLTSQMKQSIKTKIFSSIYTLSTLKKKGFKVGKLKFKSFLDSIPLKQSNKTYKIDIDNNRIKIQGIQQLMRVYGLEQIPKTSELASANFIKKCGNFYLNITTYQDKIVKSIPEQSVGIDFGCSTQLTLSNGIKIEYQVPVSKKLKRLDRKIMKGKRHNSKSNNKYKDQQKRKKEYEKLNNRKKDIKAKIVNVLVNNFKYICFQDESLNAWKASGHGKKIQNSNLGGIIRDLKNKSHTPIEVNKFFPSTQLCPKCGNKQKMPQEVRTYVCTSCGYTEDRDLKSAICLEKEGLKILKIEIPTDHREFKLEEMKTSACNVINLLKQINNIHVSFCR